MEPNCKVISTCVAVRDNKVGFVPLTIEDVERDILCVASNLACALLRAKNPGVGRAAPGASDITWPLAKLIARMAIKPAEDSPRTRRRPALDREDPRHLAVQRCHQSSGRARRTARGDDAGPGRPRARAGPAIEHHGRPQDPGQACAVERQVHSPGHRGGGEG